MLHFCSRKETLTPVESDHIGGADKVYHTLVLPAALMAWKASDPCHYHFILFIILYYYCAVGDALEGKTNHQPHA